MSKLLDDLQGRYIGVDENPAYDQEVLNAAADKRKTCVLCGKPFIKNRRAVYCNRQHYTTCVNCGDRIDLIPIYFRAGFVPKTCCKTCADTVGVQTLRDNCLEKYGVANPMHVQEYADKCFIKAHPDLALSQRRAEETRKCKICGKEFTVYRTDPKQCCSVECATALRAKHVSENIKICKWCGKKFTSSNGKSIYCSGPHYQTCVVCGTSFLLKTLDNPAQTCSIQCRDKLIRSTNLNKYGVAVGSQSPQAREKLRRAYYDSDAIRKQTCLDRYGVSNSAQADSVRSKISATVKSKDCQHRTADTCMLRYGVPHPSQSPEVHRRNWSTCKAIRGSDGTPLDSSWEKLVYDFWCALDISVERNVPITYMYNNASHVTYVDFRVNDVLYEVKGPQLLAPEATSPSGVPISAKLQVYKEHNVVVISDTSVSHLFTDGFLVGLDLDLFRDIPGSSYDAKSRWTIIEYLIKHKKGFISLSDFQ